MKTKYDEQIAFLKENPDRIESHWVAGEGIFGWVGENITNTPKDDVWSGCLTQIRGGSIGGIDHVAVIKGKVDEKLTKEIAADERIPKDQREITVDHLEIFKEWRLKIDALEEA